MSNSEKHKCEECGRVFDSKRGLHVHQSQVHKDKASSLRPKSFRPWVLVFLIIVLGLLFLSYSDYKMPQGERSQGRETKTKIEEIRGEGVIRHELKIIVGSQNATANSSNIESPGREAYKS